MNFYLTLNFDPVTRSMRLLPNRPLEPSNMTPFEVEKLIETLERGLQDYREFEELFDAYRGIDALKYMDGHINAITSRQEQARITKKD